MVGGSLGLMEEASTELRLGYGGDPAPAGKNNKRGYEQTVDLELKLLLSSSGAVAAAGDDESSSKDDIAACGAEPAAVLLKTAGGHRKDASSDVAVAVSSTTEDPADEPPVPKGQVVGWPPVGSYRRNMMSIQPAHKSKKLEEATTKGASASASGAVAFVKVSMDGAPYLRKLDLTMYRSYQELSLALVNLFSSFSSCGSQGINGRELMKESKLLKDLPNGSEYVPTYEDQDGDWMLVGDVPWEMFVDSCKRLRIMKGSDAIGLAPRAMEKCKNRS